VERADTLGLVVAGAAARGAYEAGALAALMPRLEKEAAIPKVLLGTSAGSINVAYLAATLHLGAEAATEGLCRLWRRLDKAKLMGSLVATAAPTLLGIAGRLVDLPTGSGSLANFGRFPEVFESAIEEQIKTSRGDETPGSLDELIQGNLDNRVLEAVGLAATSAETGASVVFLQKAHEVKTPPLDTKNGIRYVSVRLTVDHVMASSSIPIFFPPRRIEDADGAPGWYWDGGVRLNTPITPTLAIGGDRLGRLVIVSTGPPRYPSSLPAEPGAKPDFDDALLSVIQATLDDSLIEDLHSLVRVNRLVTQSGTTILDGRRRYEYIFAGPEKHGVLGHIAADVLNKYHSGLLHATDDFGILNRLLRRQGTQGAELESYLLFEPHFIERLLDLGYQDGEHAWTRAWLADDLPQ
jgi:NTE family protein